MSKRRVDLINAAEMVSITCLLSDGLFANFYSLHNPLVEHTGILQCHIT